jgi:hypothetical protein
MFFLAAGELQSLSQDLGLHRLLAEQALHLAQLALQGAVVGGRNDLFLRPRRRQRAGDIDASTATSILENVQRHMETRFIRQMINETAIDTALEMIDRYALRLRQRSVGGVPRALHDIRGGIYIRLLGSTRCWRGAIRTVDGAGPGCMK